MTDDTLFPMSPRRATNKTSSARADDILLTWSLTEMERTELKWNTPGPSNQLGGYQRCENEAITRLDGHAETIPGKLYKINIDKDFSWMLTRYIQRHEGGGPNERLRKAFRRYIGAGVGFCKACDAAAMKPDGFGAPIAGKHCLGCGRPLWTLKV